MDYRKSISIQYIIGIKIDFYRLLSQVSPCGSASGLEIHLVRTVCSNLSIRKLLAVIFFRQFEEIIQPETRKLSFYQKKNDETPSLRGQTVHSVHCKRNSQQAKIRFIKESATLLLFFDLRCCFGFHKQISKTLYRSKLLQKQANLRNPQLYFRNAQEFVESTNNNKTFVSLN